MIVSDIHGSAASAKLIKERFEDFAPDMLLILGDILYHGPRNDLPDGYSPKEVAAILNSMAEKIASVRGNCEAEVDQLMLDFPCLSDSMHIFDGETRIFACHGHNKELFKNLARDTVVLSGHTHVPVCVEDGGRVMMNPGSVSIPKEGSAKSYMTYEDGVFSWHELASGDTYLVYG